MAAGRVDLVIEQGEDWSVQITWTDYYESPMTVTAPMRFTMKSPYGTVAKELTVPDTPPPSGSIAPISYNAEAGLIQLHMSRTETGGLSPGIYNYDLFVSVDDGDVYAGNQVQRLLYGVVTVNLRYSAAL